MIKANAEIRNALREAGVPVWRLALAMGVCENTILRRMRVELSAEDKKKYLDIIKDLKEKTA